MSRVYLNMDYQEKERRKKMSDHLLKPSCNFPPFSAHLSQNSPSSLFLVIFSLLAFISSTKCEIQSPNLRPVLSTPSPTIRPPTASLPHGRSQVNLDDFDEETRRIEIIYRKSLELHLPRRLEDSSSEDSGVSSKRTLRRRSHRHLAICRREFLKPLEKRQTDVDLVFTGTVERIKSNNGGKNPNGWYRANVRVKQVIKGDTKFEGHKVIVEGFGSKKICDSDIKEHDSRIFLVNEQSNGRLRLNSSLIRINLDNLKKAVQAAKLIRESYFEPATTTEIWPSNSIPQKPQVTRLTEDERAKRMYRKSLELQTPRNPEELSDAAASTKRTMRRRSHRHMAICRREFLKPLEKRQSESDFVFTGTVEHIKKNAKSTHGWYRATIRVVQVLKGDPEIEGRRLLVDGFGSKKICESEVKVQDSRIFLVNEQPNGRLRLNSSLIRINLDNLKKSRPCCQNDEKASVSEFEANMI